MQKNQLMLFGAVTLVAVAIIAGIVLWRTEARKYTPSPAHILIVRDRSSSSSCACSGVVSMAETALSAPQLGKGSTLTLTATGDDATASEPIALGTFNIPVSRNVTETRDKARQPREELLKRIEQHCQQAGATKRSPVFIAIRRAVEQLRALGCNEQNHCILIVQSDLEELAVREIRDALNGAGTRGAASDMHLPAPIDNTGIEVVIYGVAETVGVRAEGGRRQTLTPQRDPQRADRVQQVWQRLFAAPQNVTFRMFCPKN